LSTTCVQELSDSPIDIIGDIHGELSALESLLKKLGYDDRGRHSEGRKLVFVGDLIDRGPDSPGVLRSVIRLVESGNAQCISGNHELNAVRNDSGNNRSGEGWWYGKSEAEYDYTLVDPDEKQRSFLPFLRSLPGALEREDLRVIHACWHEPSVEKLRGAGSVIEAFKEEAEALQPRLKKLRSSLEQPWKDRGMTPAKLKDRQNKVELIPELAHFDQENQMGNAVKVATSGMERAADDSFYASGKWRMVRRVPWWEEYTGPPVVVGHYWRRYYPERPANAEKVETDLFGDTPPENALGPERQVMCIDYSVGMRFHERRRHGATNAKSELNQPTRFDGCLAALRVPEWQLVFDDGRKGLQVNRGRA
jgi:hypothetical protein